MRKFGVIIFLVVFVASCEKEDNQISNFQISDGCYQGFFDYQNTQYWCSICFENGKYFERPAMELFVQKSLGCLTIGTYSTASNILSFESELQLFNELREPCLTDIYLPGTYTIANTELQDSLIFSRGTGDNQIIYQLKKLDLDK